MYVRSRLKLLVIFNTLVQKSIANAGGGFTSSSGGAEVDASGQTPKLIDVLDRRATELHEASRLLRTVSESSLVEAKVSVNVDVEQSDGAESSKISRQNTAQASSADAAGSSKTSVWGFRDTCFSLYWFGFVRTATCRDSWMPERTSSCRCERGGTAWPAKYCDSSGQAGNAPDATTAASLFELDAIGMGNPQTLKAMNLDKQEVYGLCDTCCERVTILAWETWVFPLLLICGCCSCCISSCKAVGQLTHLQKQLAKKQNEASLAQ